MRGTDGERYGRVVELFRRACELPEPEREAFLRDACAGDAEVLARVRALLNQDSSRADPLDRVADAVSDVLAVGKGADLFVPERIGSFRVLGLIGEGGMGIVYEAEQESPRRAVALKVVRPGMATPQNLRRFELESDVLGRLEHPGIARIYEAGMAETPWGRVPYFAMERVRGRSIVEHCAVHALGRRARLELLARVCEAVEHAHAKGIVHRDLKSVNVLVTEDGAPKVLDFGVARLVERGADAPTELTLEGQIVGTLATMSPEQVRGDSHAIDARTDVYALGAIGYELLAERQPLDLATKPLAEAARIVEEVDPAPLSSIDPGCRGDLDVIFATALEKDPARRYASASALAADLRRHLRDEPILARPPTAVTLLRKFARRNRALVAGATAGVAALAIGGAVATWKAVEATRSGGAALRQSYRANLSAAVAALRIHDVGEAALRLDEAPPELRGWEWRHLRSRLDESVAVCALGKTEVTAIDVSPDGRWIAAADPAGRLELRSSNDGERVSGLDAPIGNVVAVRFMPGGDALRVASADLKFVRVFALDVPSLARRSEWQAEVLRCTGAAFSADGSRLLCMTSNPRLVALDASTGTEQWASGIRAYPASPSFSPDGSRIAVADELGFEVRRAEDGSTVFRRVDAGGARAASFSADSSKLVVAMFAPDARICDASTGADLHVLVGHGAGVTDAVFSLDGASAATASADGAVRLWDAKLGILRQAWRGHLGRLRRVAFTPDGSRLVTAGEDGTVRIWSAADTGEPYVLPHEQTVYAVAFSPDGRRLATGALFGGHPTLRVWDVATGAPVAAWLDDHRHVTSLAWSPDGARLAIGGQHTDTELVDAATGRVLASARGHDYNTDSISFEPTGRRFITTGNDGQLLLWDVATGARLAAHELGPGQDDSSPIYRAIFSRDGAWIAASRLDGSIEILDGATLNPRASWRAHQDPVTALAVSADGRRLASGSKAGAIGIWRTTNWTEVARLRNHVNEVFALAFSPDGSRLVSGGRDRTIRVWDTESWDLVTQLAGHTSFVYSLAFSPDGETLASGGGDDSVRLWGVRTRAERERLRRERSKRLAEAAPVVDAAFAADADVAGAVARLRAHAWRDGEAAETALQAALARAVASRPAPR